MQKFSIKDDLIAGTVVFLVAVPLCLGIALASGAPLFAGLIGGIVGGLFVSLVSKSETSITGPAAGLSAVVFGGIVQLGSYETFTLAVIFAGSFQIVFSLLRFGVLATYFPSSVVHGFMAAIGIILILKQIPHLVGFDKDVEGDFSFFQMDNENTFSELLNLSNGYQVGSLMIGLSSLLILWFLFRSKKTYTIHPFFMIIVYSLFANFLLEKLTFYPIAGTHLVNVPISNGFSDFFKFFHLPDFSQIQNPQIYSVAFVLALVASLETLLNIEAIDKLDPHKRHTPPNRELLAQGGGNIISGMLGGLPITAVIVRGSVALHAGGKTKLTSIVYGVLLAITVIFFPKFLNMIPLSALAAILIVTGYKLASLEVFKSMYKKGNNQFYPFLITIIAIVFSDLLTGFIIGLVVGFFFILRNNMKNAFQVIDEKRYNQITTRIRLSQEATFLNKPFLRNKLYELPHGSSVILDAHSAEYVDPDIIEIIKDFQETVAPEKNIDVSLVGFKDTYHVSLSLENQTVQVVTPELLKSIRPEEVLQILKDGNKRFVSGNRIEKDLLHQMNVTSEGQNPLAVVLSCMDSRTSVELVFDMGLGDLFSIRVAGNVVNPDILASIEFACKVVGTKLILVLGHTSCGAIKGACADVKIGKLPILLKKIKPVIKLEKTIKVNRTPSNDDFVNQIALLNTKKSMQDIVDQSPLLKKMILDGEVGLYGGMYDISTGEVSFSETYSPGKKK
ncbi:bifunctional SulP family inorganic anion transporter/carbonic anhydrase [Leptospira idonii]|uniref:Carbonic anhydrase n=1 Tax=Leptospira idonii TaxID=1193500 RepID=A0A4R9M0F4_9LEPT|nr:SulP family inorganic anion transporter [Leptospira idonii]TGN20194.1 carbonic anhydrase [Leptospira idonii]